MEVKIGKYRHFKVKEYEVIRVTKHSETLDELVIYKALYNNSISKLLARPKNMFLETIKINDQTFRRFEFIE